MKKVLSLVLALAMAIGMTTVGFAADTVRNMDDSDVDNSGMLQVLFGNGSTWEDDSLTLDEDIEAVFDTDIKDFNTWVDGSGSIYAAAFVKGTAEYPVEGSATATTWETVAHQMLDKRMVDRWDIGVRLSNTSIFAEASVDDDGILEFTTVEYLPGTSTKDADIDITLTVGDRSVSSSKAELSASLKNKAIKVEDRDDEEISLDDTENVLDPQVSIPKFSVFLSTDGGDEVVVNTRLFDGTKLYLKLLTDEDDLSIALADKWGFAHHYKFLQNNLVLGASTINFDLAGTWAYAVDNSADYDAVADSVKLVYVGRGDADLPIYEDYYFSVTELELETDAPVTEPEPPTEGEGEVPGEVENPAGGPTDSVPVNYNPGTGR